MDFITESGCKREPVLLQVQPRFADCRSWELLVQEKNLFYEPLELSMGGHYSEDMLEWYRNSGRVRTIHGNFIDVNPASGDEDYRMLSQYKCHESCKLAKTLGADRVVFHSSIFPYLSGGYLENWVAVCADFYSMLSEEYHMTICVENSMDLDPEPLYRLMKKMNGGIEWVCVCLDMGHANYSRAGLDEWFDMLGEYIGHIHLSDNMGYFDDHLPLGQGTVDWPLVQKRWEQLNRKVPVTLEVGGIDGVKESLAFLERNKYFGLGEKDV